MECVIISNFEYSQKLNKNTIIVDSTLMATSLDFDPIRK